ncbi:MAG: hypothetical protein IJK18_09210 [Clostridia bacterium]|nr:hypothetical protein [Clostridia bacterium]
MINVYNWSYQVDKSLVRIEFHDKMKLKLQSAIKKYNGQDMPIKTEQNEFIVKFKNSKVANDFIDYILQEYPNSFTLSNDWDIAKYAENILSLTAIREYSDSTSALEKIIHSLFSDCKIISSLTKYDISNVQISAESSLCYFSFIIEFKTSEDAQIFLDEFLNFKA